jgi:hypothetical protein
MIRHAALVLAGLVSTVLPGAASGQARRYPLTSTEGLHLHNATAEVVTFRGKRGLRVGVSPELARRPEYLAGQIEPETFARIDGLEFANGVIEVELAGVPGGGAYPGARGFVGIAFRLQADRDPDGAQAYDAIYLRPTNGCAEDQERRNHSVQYISHPDWTWSRLRRETPSRYEAYVDLVPDSWTKVRIEVRGTQARLYVRDQPQPTLIVNDIKSGPSAKGSSPCGSGRGRSRTSAIWSSRLREARRGARSNAYPFATLRSSSTYATAPFTGTIPLP